MHPRNLGVARDAGEAGQVETKASLQVDELRLADDDRELLFLR